MVDYAFLVLLLAAVALGWKAYQLKRAPWDRALWIISVSILTVLWPGRTSGWAGPVAGTIIDAAVPPLFALLVLAFLYAAARTDAGSHIRLQVAAAAAIFGLQVTLVLWLASRGRTVGTFDDADLSIPAVVSYYVLSCGYLCYAVGLAGFLAWRLCRVSDTRTRLGLRVTAVGLGICALSGAARVFSVVARSHGLPTAAVDTYGCVWMLNAGLVAFLAGVTYPGLSRRWAATRRWNWHRRVYHQLQPLWEALHLSFPDGTLARYGAFEPRFPWQRTSLRASRRIIECWDGLVRISPHLVELGVTERDDPRGVAALLHRALADRRGGYEVAGAPMRLLRPAQARLDSDVSELLALTSAFEEQVRSAPR